MILSIHLSRKKLIKTLEIPFFSKYFFYFGAHFEQKLVYKKIENPIFKMNQILAEVQVLLIITPSLKRTYDVNSPHNSSLISWRISESD